MQRSRSEVEFKLGSTEVKDRERNHSANLIPRFHVTQPPSLSCSLCPIKILGPDSYHTFMVPDLFSTQPQSRYIDFNSANSNLHVHVFDTKGIRVLRSWPQNDYKTTA